LNRAKRNNIWFKAGLNLPVYQVYSDRPLFFKPVRLAPRFLALLPGLPDGLGIGPMISFIANAGFKAIPLFGQGHGKGIDQPGVIAAFGHMRLLNGFQQGGKNIGHPVQALHIGDITREPRKPGAQMPIRLVINTLDLSVLVQHAEQVNGKASSSVKLKSA
jgi:hypothetical protein